MRATPERKAKAFKAAHRLTYLYLIDREQAGIDRFSVSGALPHVVIIGKDSRLLYSQAGDVVSRLNAILTKKRAATEGSSGRGGIIRYKEEEGRVAVGSSRLT